jgi:hypothetical protein
MDAPAPLFSVLKPICRCSTTLICDHHRRKCRLRSSFPNADAESGSRSASPREACVPTSSRWLLRLDTEPCKHLVWDDGAARPPPSRPTPGHNQWDLYTAPKTVEIVRRSRAVLASPGRKPGKLLRVGGEIYRRKPRSWTSSMILFS